MRRGIVKIVSDVSGPKSLKRSGGLFGESSKRRFLGNGVGM